MGPKLASGRALLNAAPLVGTGVRKIQPRTLVPVCCPLGVVEADANRVVIITTARHGRIRDGHCVCLSKYKKTNQNTASTRSHWSFR
jgi:hypothetical protein